MSVHFSNRVTRRNFRQLTPIASNEENQNESNSGNSGNSGNSDISGNSFLNMPNESLKSSHNIPYFSFLTDFLPANHYNKQRRNAKTRKNKGRPYPYAEQNARNAASIIERVNTEKEAIATLDILYPNTLTPYDSFILKRILNSVREHTRNHLTHIVQTQFRKKYVDNGLPIPEDEYNATASSLFKRYLKHAVHDVTASHFSEDKKQRLVAQLRKKILLERMRKGWFGAKKLDLA